MKSAKRIVLCLLAFCLILVTFSACGESGEDPTEPASQGEFTDETTAQTEESDILVIDKKFNRELNVLVRTYQQYNREWGCDLGSDMLSEQIVERNDYIEEQLGITMHFLKVGDDTSGNNYVTKVTEAQFAGMHDVDIVSAYAAYSTLPAAMECFSNLRNSERFPWFHLDKEYWNHGYIDVAEMNGKLFTAVGDANLSVFDRTIITYVNKTLADDHGVDMAQIYRDVFAGNWTYEKFYKIVTDIGFSDIDEDEGLTGGDFFALTSIRGSEAPDAFLQAFDLALFEQDEQGTWTLAKKTMRTKLEDAMTKIQNLFNNSNSAFTRGDTTVNLERFTERRAIFNIDVIYHYDSALNQMLAMTDQLGMIPIPKYDENQKEYKASVQDAHNVVAVVDYGAGSEDRYEAISALLEMLNYESFHNLRPYYFERMIKARYVDAPEDAQCFDIILASTAWDLSDVYGGNLSFLSDGGTMQAPRHLLWRTALQGNVAVSTRFAEYEALLTNKLSTFLGWIGQQS